MSNATRFHLVTKLVCSQCGDYLRLSNAEPKNRPHGNAVEANDGITGADKVEQFVSVEPCKRCYEEATAPIRALKAALK